MIRPVIAITHASFDEKRRHSLAKLVSQLAIEAPVIDVQITEDVDRKGSLWCWRTAMLKALEAPVGKMTPPLGWPTSLKGRPEGYSHVVWLPDDVQVCRDFGAILRACIEARPADVWDGFVNHPMVKEWGHRTNVPPWYATFEGYTGVVGCMPRGALEEHLSWRERYERHSVSPANDAGVNLWAMATKRLIYKTSYSLAKHDLTVPSLEGHDEQRAEGHEREGARFLDDFRIGIWEDCPNLLGRTYRPGTDGPRGNESVFLGRTYVSNHLALLHGNAVSVERIETYFDIERNAGIQKLPGKRTLFVAAPSYGQIVHAGWMSAVMHEIQDLKTRGVDVVLDLTVSDSLVNRARNRLVSNFLASGATDLLFWDVDNFPKEPGHVARMMATGLDLVGAAVPLKDGKAKSFAFRWGPGVKDDSGSSNYETVEGCIEVESVGTGLMLISRRCILDMASTLHSQTFYQSGMHGSVGRAEWHLFADSVRTIEGRRLHMSEDWEFCRRWADIGGKVYLYPYADFVHFGTHPYEGSFTSVYPKSADGGMVIT